MFHRVVALMNLRAYLIRKRILPVFVSAVILCSITLSYLNVPIVSAAKPRILVTHSVTELIVGETFTTTVNLTDFPNLQYYVVVLKYNGAVLNLTSLWSPNTTDFVFAGQNLKVSWTKDAGLAGDTVDHLNYTVADCFGINPVSVSNGTLCKLNFTVVQVGPTNFTVATINYAAHATEGAIWYTYCMDDEFTEFTDFDINSQQLPPPDLTILIIEIAAVVVVAVIGGVGLFLWRRRRIQTEKERAPGIFDTSNTQYCGARDRIQA